ncbi:hypothetical protein [Marinobacter sp. JSM 1782161]|uniref:hypothetical protein n=1 Tax=Marinobacter sp. JSM 1782161 TaxID=2685906 RepID=UPI001403F595|nr:hypothetical protein [Marinobacter sp. JSM 1782161]
MLRALLVIVIIVGAVSLMVFGPQYLRTLQSEPAASAQDTAADVCDLSGGPCQWSGSGDGWQVSLERRNPDAPEQLALRVKAPAGALPEGALVAVLSGHSMYMGEYPVPLQANGDTYVAEFEAPLCSQDPDMAWTLALQSGQQALPLPMNPVFRTRH